MSLRGQPGLDPRDLIQVQPVAYEEDPRGEDYGNTWVARGRPIEVYSEKLTSGELFVEGKSNLTLGYKMYANYRRGTALPVSEKERVWHPEGSRRNPDGTPDYSTALDVSSVVPFAKDGVCQIDAGRTF